MAKDHVDLIGDYHDKAVEKLMKTKDALRLHKESCKAECEECVNLKRRITAYELTADSRLKQYDRELYR